ncbi:phage holin family protein [Sphingobacterium alkalisoli]|uniref:Phage holin family protein n=1 Tax=Sphingobacterium alkalisoli TaxID=1874115 RepID=A0A4U0HBN2_9SPHI|nr:phage holin family protein [Sphingobacterium alkalisoli]TJY68002.1 phage holin family protein [Sphingobacterium alkalisoli]GGH09758.1 membrane protein [Sphingobacterium alkalisoli]
MRFIISLLLTGLVVALASYVIPGVQVAGFGWAIVTGLVIGFVNAVIGGILRLFTFPLNWLTFGLVSFIITVLMVMLSDSIMGSKFDVSGFWAAALFAVVVALLEMILGRIGGEKSAR